MTWGKLALANLDDGLFLSSAGWTNDPNLAVAFPDPWVALRAGDHHNVKIGRKLT